MLRVVGRLLVGLACCLASACGSPSSTAVKAPRSSAASSTPSSAATARSSDTIPAIDIDENIVARVAWARLRWPGATVLEANRVDRLQEAVPAGSLFKLVVARALLAQGVVTSETRVTCPRTASVHGRRVDCVHPELGRPLTLEDALAHSCNHFFVSLADRLDRARLDITLRELSGGAVFIGSDAPLPLVVLGLDGPRSDMLTWTHVAMAAMTRDSDRPGDAAIVRRGAARAASEGTARALRDPAMLTFAKTGTTMTGANQEGRVVAWRPERGEAIIVRAPGVPGRDAAQLARAIWDRDPADTRSVRVGRTRALMANVQPEIERVPLERYVAGVVAAEAEAGTPQAALDALAIVVRSYAQAPNPRHARDGYDVCDTTHCQVLGEPTAESRAAAARTAGIVLTRAGQPVAAPYSASCSGVLSAPRDIWGGSDPPVTRTGPDPAGHPVDRWEGRVESQALLTALREAGHRGDALRDVRISVRTPDGLPTRVALEGLAPDDLDAMTFRHVVGRRIGWEVLKSHAWDVERTARGYRFTGRGKGHGAGLCLRGASVLAGRGSSSAQLLATYVPGAQSRALQDRVVLRVPGPLTAIAGRLRDDAQSQLADLRVRLSMSTPRDVEIVVHPTREAYQRATGRAWWTSASSRHLDGIRYRIDLAPPPGLDRGTSSEAADELSSTFRHEAVHVLTGPALALGPAWAAEGLAHLIARDEVPASAPQPPGPCPVDGEVSRPGGLAKMREVYARSAACAAAALPDGVGTWRTLAARP